MLSLATAFEAEIDTGLPLPEVWPSLTRAGIRLRRSQVVMAAGQPNACKSIFATNIVAELKDVPTLYFSCDMDMATAGLRLAAHLSGKTVNEIEEETRDPAVAGYYSGLLAEADHLWWSFEPQPTPEQLALQLEAFCELFGAPPSLIVVDNLSDISPGGENEWAALRQLMKLFAYWARHTRACVLILHHTAEGPEYKPEVPQPRRAIQGKLSQKPALILTLAVEGDTFKVACVKDRHGPHDPSGKTYVSLDIDRARMTISEPVWTPTGVLKGAYA